MHIKERLYALFWYFCVKIPRKQNFIISSISIKGLIKIIKKNKGRQDKENEEDDDKSIKKRFKHLKKAFADPLTEVYISFFTSALPLFTHYNLFLQRSDPQAHNLHKMTQSLIKKKLHLVFWKRKRYQIWPSRIFKMSQTAFL